MNHEQMIHKSFDTIMEMLTDRGVDVSHINSTILTSIATDSHTFQVRINKDIIVLYHLKDKLQWPSIEKQLTEVLGKNENIANLQYIIVIAAPSYSLQFTRKLHELELDYQVFHIKTLQFNIYRHEMVPKHEVIRANSPQIQIIIDNYKLVDRYKFPVILKADAMSKYLGLKKGDLVKITRDSPSSGEYILYRVCV